MPFLLADWIEALLPLVFVFIWIARLFLEGKGAVQAEPGDDEPIILEGDDEEFAGVGPNRQRGKQAKAGGDPIRSEVDEFLRRLSGDEGQPANKPTKADWEEERESAEQQRREEQERQARIERRQRQNEERREQLRRDREERQRQLAERRRQAAGEETETPSDSGSRLRHLEESQLAENAAHLGEQLAQTDERVAARLQQKFDHKLGKLESRRAEAKPADEPATSSAAETIAAMLSDPGGVRNAVILNEILTRPTDRW